MSTDDADTERRLAPHSSPVPVVGMILPGTVQVLAIEPQRTAEGQPLQRWRITLRGVVRAGAGDLADMECQLSFTTADESLIHQVRAQRYRYVLDLIQLQREGPEEGEVEDT